MKKQPKFIIEKCNVCGKDFKKLEKRERGSKRSVGFRGKNCITCSPKCSKLLIIKRRTRRTKSWWWG